MRRVPYWGTLSTLNRNVSGGGSSGSVSHAGATRRFGRRQQRFTDHKHSFEVSGLDSLPSTSSASRSMPLFSMSLKDCRMRVCMHGRVLQWKARQAGMSRQAFVARASPAAAHLLPLLGLVLGLLSGCRHHEICGGSRWQWSGRGWLAGRPTSGGGGGGVRRRSSQWRARHRLVAPVRPPRDLACLARRRRGAPDTARRRLAPALDNPPRPKPVRLWSLPWFSMSK